MAPPVVLLHCATRDETDFDPFLPYLKGFRATAVDHIGHGSAPRANTYHLLDYANAIALPAEPSLLYGHSLGGMAALCAARRAPERVSALVLEDPPLFDSRPPRLSKTPWPEGFARLKSIIQSAHRKGWTIDDWQNTVARWPSGHGRLTTLEAGGPDAVTRRARQVAALDPAMLDPLADGRLHDGVDLVEAVRECPLPIVVVAGTRAEGSGLSQADARWLSSLAHVTLLHADGVGHYVRERRPDLCRHAFDLAFAQSPR